jgi:hypothetical protein
MGQGPLLLVALALAGPAADRVPDGSWGGRDASLVVGPEGVQVELNCSHGTVEGPLALDAKGTFRVRGYWVREGGPTLPDEDRRPAVYSGRLKGKTLTLLVEVEDPKQEAGPFSLVLGEPPKLFKCD